MNAFNIQICKNIHIQFNSVLCWFKNQCLHISIFHDGEEEQKTFPCQKREINKT